MMATSAIGGGSSTMELSIEETNKLRLSLGLAPLKLPSAVPAPRRVADSASADARATKAVADKIEMARRKRALELSGPTLGDASFDSSLASATTAIKPSSALTAKRVKKAAVENIPEHAGEVGASGIMVLQDSSVLNGDDLAEDEAKLVAVESGGRLSKKNAASSSSSAAAAAAYGDTEQDDEDKPFAPQGARLYVSDAASAVGNSINAEVTRKKPSKSSKKAPTVVIPKIERKAPGAKRAVRKRDSDDEVESPVNGDNRASPQEAEEEEEDDLEAALARARQARISSAETIASRALAAPAGVSVDSAAEGEGDVMVMGTFMHVEAPSDHAEVTMEGAVMADGDQSLHGGGEERSGGVALAAAPDATSTATLSAAAAAAASTDSMPAPPPPKAKPTHRTLASSLAALFESADLAPSEEILVGRSRDAKPDLSLNRPTDAVKYELRDDHGRLLTPKEAFRQLSYQMRGQKPSVKKQEKRQEEIKRQQLVQAARAGDTPLNTASATNKLLQKQGTAHLTLQGGGAKR